ncbi:hypothetical protein Pst134EA_015234 [Puccinia striiformis f. sp. tritici]|uniref:hypothetical protein n=1 Tax=Puccinia striiformis f. sp. tritici TaxID=168172 RepID=UPI0020082701|nr:hypothetical protein Pst134EA_015234 [Puccinia striiformis f. sp. tritici]KAH9463150.1 hypothetical protein Pst134EA_015234 [Puccinia striiformis f. sp. tritici]
MICSSCHSEFFITHQFVLLPLSRLDYNCDSIKPLRFILGPFFQLAGDTRPAKSETIDRDESLVSVLLPHPTYPIDRWSDKYKVTLRILQRPKEQHGGRFDVEISEK